MTVRKALVLSFLDRWAGLVLNLASAMVIARLLTPAEIGVHSVVMAFCSFAIIFRDFGASQYLIRHPGLTQEVMQRGLTVLLIMSSGFAIVVAACGVPLAAFYDEPRMVGITWILAANFLANAVLAYPVALLTREMRFGQLAVVRVVGGLAGTVVSVGLVVLGLGPSSLAWGSLMTTVAGLACVLFWARPVLSWRTRLDGLREVFAFGGLLSAVSALVTLRGALPELVIGRTLGLAHASHLSRAQGLCSMFDTLVTSAVWPVVLPYLSQARTRGQDVGPILARALALLCGLGWPFFAVLAVLAEPAILILFGSQWGDAVAPVRWLALAAAAGLPFVLFSAALIAAGAMKPLLIVNAVATVAAALALLVGSTVNLQTSCAALALASVVVMAPSLEVLRRRLCLTSSQLYWPLVGALGLSAVAAGVPLGLTLFFDVRGYASALGLGLASIAAALAVYTLALRSSGHPLWHELGVRLIDKLKGSPKSRGL